MSTAYSSAKQQYIGNGVTTEWGFDFPIKKHSELKVYLKRSGQTQVLLEEGVDYSFVTENTIAFPIKTGEAKLQAADVLALQRESVFESEYNFSNQQRLEPEEVMHADDNLERQIQELKRDSEAAIKVLPTSNIDPNMFFEQVDRVYGSVDNIDTVANDKANVDAVAGNITNVNTVAGDIESVKTVENNIESVVIDATNISHIKTVSGSIANVNKTAGSIDNVNVVAPSISSVNTVATNISSVNTAASNMAAIKAAPTAATNAAQSAANAANSATISANSAIWAEGTDAQVQALGGTHSSKGWAEQSTSVNISLTNTPYTTNRILEIPQDIKLELNNGTLTLKAGSKFYVPNGFEADGTTPKFDIVTIDSDKIASPASSFSGFLFYRSDNNYFHFEASQPTSGTTPPSEVGTWYDTNANKIKRYENSSFVYDGVSFPLCKFSSGSIDQVFNGFGYIGSTVFALPGVKCQFADGRNEDGTYKSITKTFDNVSLVSYAYQIQGTDRQPLSINDQGILTRTYRYVIQNNQPALVDTVWYKPETNETFRSNGSSVFTKSREIIIVNGILTNSEFNITSFEPLEVPTVNSYQRAELAGMGMPSGKNIKLTVGASRATYTAPANGWFFICVKATANGASYNMFEVNDGYGVMNSNLTANCSYKALMPIIAGRLLYFGYNDLDFTSHDFLGLWFIYAQGEQ